MAAPSPRASVTVVSPSKRCGAKGQIQDWQQRLHCPDINGCIVFSKLRCVISIFSLVLLVTDIPRSGLGVRHLSDYYPALVMPDTAVRFGPYEYPVRHIRRVSENGSDSTERTDTFEGFQGAEPVDSANVWSYKYDTTSLGLRGAVDLLNVTGFPDFLLYKGKLGKKNLQHSTLELETTFTMLDLFITAAQAQLSPENTEGVTSPTALRFATKHIWVDRIHHYVTQFIKKSKVWSLHSLHMPRVFLQTKSLGICKNSVAVNASSVPRFCNYPGTWKCEHPLNTSAPPVRLWDQMDIRFQDLQQRYPDLRLQVVIISTHRPSTTSGALSKSFFNYEEQEIIMLTRGRRCTLVVCATIFIDDYRYERNILQTNIVDWYLFISMMRGGAQCYFWIRLFFLYHAAFIVAGQADARKHHWYTRIISTISIVLKIPFQVIVYSSPLPVAGYVVALLLDGNFMDIFLDSYWASLEGVTNFDVVPFFQSTVTQMRTVWLMALLGDLVAFVSRKVPDAPTKPSIRGLVISFIAALTILGPYKQSMFRNSRIVNIIMAPDVQQTMDTVKASPQLYLNASSYAFDDSMTMLIFCIAVVAAIAAMARSVDWLLSPWFRPLSRGLVLNSTFNVPCGTDRLWPASSLSIRFNTLTSYTLSNYELTTQHVVSPEPTSQPVRLSKATVIPAPPSNLVTQRSNSTSSRLSKRQYVKGWQICASVCRTRVKPPTTKTTKPPPGGLRWRTTESHSILQLMNVAMMTDPWNLFCLRVLGIQLYLYKIRPTQPTELGARTDSSSRSFGLVSYAVILPYSEDEMEERTGLSVDEYELLDWANSRDIPMSILLQCG